jgi:pSer/pThr/pTyr-binding forkhead associated (FHA) protein
VASDDDFESTTIVGEVPVPPSLLPKSKRPFYLEQVAGPGAGRQFVLELAETVIGRSLQATVSIDAGGISRQHAVIKRDGPEYTFTDLNRANGVYLNGVKTHSAVLREGDTIQLGEAVFVFHEGG